MWPLPKVIMRLGSEAFSLPQELLFDTSAPGGRLKDAFWNQHNDGLLQGSETTTAQNPDPLHLRHHYQCIDLS